MRQDSCVRRVENPGISTLRDARGHHSCEPGSDALWGRMPTQQESENLPRPEA